MRAYPIWNDVTACGYKASKSYGVRETGQVIINIGTSRVNSHEFITHTTTRRIEGEYTVFRFGVDVKDGMGLRVISTRYMETKSREMKPIGWTP